eukprot:CAMPEP_0178969742 /NCGR_PEP_ID=MMETSP0789-20121207/19057_1 /TAXON_ID=3005 /ORGANISM="Rhizosolenia setigera, Strain CCMP 1694" /LENGTH=205 /DNA_ID=CAMNT_0020655973 /DNA_START=192 /DNA_END=809 /DNA_ORIENTATION=+
MSSEGKGISTGKSVEKDTRKRSDDSGDQHISQQIESEEGEPTRQVIAVSASKGPAAFFNLARKFLITDEMCDLSALEGAIVSAVDAAHLLERSKLATIVRIRTSYVAVGPKRKRNPATNTPDIERENMPPEIPETHDTDTTERHSSAAHAVSSPPGTPSHIHKGSKELRRSRIIITVKRTPDYVKWLENNPIPQQEYASDDEQDG